MRPIWPQFTQVCGKRAISASASPSMPTMCTPSAARHHALGDHQRQPASARQDADAVPCKAGRSASRTRRQAWRASASPVTRAASRSGWGMHSERLPPARMKATISLTIGWSANSSSTSASALHQRALVGKQQPVGAAQAVDVVAREAAPLQADDVEARQVRAVAERHAVGDEVVLQARHAADEGMRADARELDARRRRRR